MRTNLASHRKLLASVALASALLAGACGSSSGDSASGAAPAAAPATTPAATPAAGSIATPSTTAAPASGDSDASSSGYGSEYGSEYGSSPADSPTTAAPQSGTAPSGGATVSLASTSLGQVLVDSQGMTLYAYMKDTQGQPSVCEGGCAVAWPPVTAGQVTPGSGIDASKLTTIARSDGSMQAAYNGWPLYEYAKDAKPGDVTGQGVGGIWYVMDASGNVVKG
jgi:predicted lipoprotein with Yx(FWY)xxD motif